MWVYILTMAQRNRILSVVSGLEAVRCVLRCKVRNLGLVGLEVRDSGQ